MPDADSETRLRFVKTNFESTEFKYVFYSRLDPKKHAAFGQEAVTKSIKADKVIIASNNFKPFRAQKLEGGDKGWEGSFCADGKITTLRNDNYDITEKKVGLYSATKLSDIFVAIFNGVPVAWHRPKIPSEIKLTEIGVKMVSSEKELIFGARFPKPPIVQKTLSNGSTFQTFCGPDAMDGVNQLKDTVKNNGWKIVKRGRYTDAAFHAMAKV